MIKAAHLSLGLAVLLALPAAVRAQQDNSTTNAVNMAVNQAVLNQANTIVLRQQLATAKETLVRGDIEGAAKLYQKCVSLAQQIGPGVEPETREAVAGLADTSLTLARQAQSRGNYHQADVQIQRVLKADPKNSTAIALKKQNDQMIAAMKGKEADQETLEQVPQIKSQKTDAATLVQDGKLFYEMGKLDAAERKLNAALKLDPNNRGAYYYLNLVKQANFARESAQHNADTQTRITQVEKQWVLPQSSVQLPEAGNPYATNDLIYTGPGRQAIVDKLNRIRLDSVNFDGLPLSEVLRQLSEQSKLRDPEHKGINFLINPNPDQSGQPVASSQQNEAGGGVGGLPGQPAAPMTINPATGLPEAQTTTAAGGGTEKIDIGTADTVKLHLEDVRLADVLDAIVMVADHPDGHQLKYSIEDFGVVFSDKGKETPQLFTRTFKVDPNTFYSGLQSVSSESFGSVNNNSSGGGGFGGGGGGGGGSSGNNNQNNGAIVGVVNAFAGAGGLRNYGSQGGGGGGGGGGGNSEGSVNPLANAAGGGTSGGNNNTRGGLQYITQVTLSSEVSAAARAFFTTLGVNLNAPPGKSVFFNDRTGVLLVRATEQDLDTIEKAIQVLNQVAPEVQIKARFVEVQQNDSHELGFDWYLGQFNIGNEVVGQGGNPGSLTVPASAANPLGAFPGATAAQTIADQGQQLFSSGLSSAASGATTATITGILTNPNFQVVLHALETRSGVENLGEPEAVTMSGRQTQMRATRVVTVVTGLSFQQGSAPQTAGVGTTTTGR